MISSLGDEARPSDDVFTPLYRAVGLRELEDIRETGRLLPGPRTMGGKWFAEEAEHAARWGELLEGPGNFRVIVIEVPTGVVNELFRIERLDGIGPAKYTGKIYGSRSAWSRTSNRRTNNG